MSFPTAVPLMQPTRITQPFHRDGWVYEEKVDGWSRVSQPEIRQSRSIVAIT